MGELALAADSLWLVGRGARTVFANLPAQTNDAAVLAMVYEGKGRLDRIGGMFKGTLQQLRTGPNRLTIVTFEPTGSRSIKRVTAACWTRRRTPSQSPPTAA